MKSLRLISLVLLLTTSLFAKSKKQYEAEYNKESQIVIDLFKQEKWTELDALLSETLAKKERFLRASFRFQSYTYRAGIDYIYGENLKPQDWNHYYSKLRAWQKACPQSTFIAPLKIRYWTCYAWDARGNGYSHTVTKDGWSLFGERLAKANEVFEKATNEGNYPNPMLYNFASSIALGQGWSEEKVFDKIVTPLVNDFPWYDSGFMVLDLNFEPKWGGSIYDRFEYLSKVARRLPEQHGNTFYAKAILFNLNKYNHRYQSSDIEEHIETDRLEPGLKSLINESPNDAFYLERYFMFLSRYGNFEALQLAYNDFKSNHPKLVKPLISKSPYLMTLDFASNFSAPPLKEHQKTSLRGTYYSNSIREISYFNHSDKLFLSLGKTLEVRKRSTGELLFSKDLNGTWGYQSNISHDDNHVVVMQNTNSTNTDNRCVVYDISNESFKEVANLPLKSASAKDIKFSHDSKKVLICTSQTGENKKSSFSIWSWQDRPINVATHNYTFIQKRAEITLVPDRNEVIVADGKQLKSYLTTKPTEKQTAYSTNGNFHFTNGDVINNGEIYVVLASPASKKKKGKPIKTELHLYNTKSKKLIKKFPFTVGKLKPALFIEVLPGKDANSWHIFSTNYQGALNTWELKKSKGFQLKHVGTQVISDQFPFLFTCNKKDSELLVGDDSGTYTAFKLNSPK